MVEIDGCQIDLQLFDDAVLAARLAASDGDLPLAVAEARRGLRFWRGPAFEGVRSRLVEAEAARLTEHRLSLIEDCNEWELALGHHHEIVGELSGLVAQYPARERLHAQLMLALYRSGRQADALDAYKRAWKNLRDMLGLEPGPELQSVQRAILNRDTDLYEHVLTGRSVRPLQTSAETFVVPRQLPTDIGGFVGREEESAAIVCHLGNNARQSKAVTIVAISGKGGVGKTALAVHAAHRAADVFPDGQLYVDLHGTEPRRANPAEVLARFLRAFGLAVHRVPAGLEERAELYRSWLADKRVLLVLDNAAEEAQVVPLLPGGSGCGVVVTSRARLTGLPGALHIEPDVLDRDQSIELILSKASAAHAGKDNESLSELARLCGHLPLALSIAGAKLAARPHWTVVRMVESLSDRRQRLNELVHGTQGVRANLTLSYDALGQRAQAMFRHLSLLDAPVASAWIGAALMNTSVDESRRLLDSLVDAQLVEATRHTETSQTRYRLHDLVHVFARERAQAEDSKTEREAAIKRAFGAWLAFLEALHGKIYGGDYMIPHGDAARWSPDGTSNSNVMANVLTEFEEDRLSVVSAVRQAAGLGLDELCWDLAVTATTFFSAGCLYDDWLETHQCALAATRGAGNRRGEAVTLTWLAELWLAQHEYGKAGDCCRQALRIFEELRDLRGITIANVHLAHVARSAGNRRAALSRYERKILPALGECGDPCIEAYAFRSLGQVFLELRDSKSAAPYIKQALDIARAIGSPRDQALAHYWLGAQLMQQGRLLEAQRAYGEVFRLVSEYGDRRGRAAAMLGIATTHLHLGEFEASRTRIAKVLSVAKQAGDSVYETRALRTLDYLDQRKETPSSANGGLGWY